MAVELDRLIDLKAIQAARSKRYASYMMRLAGIPPDEWQRRLLDSTAQKLLICCSRQVGKSTTVAGLADHTAFYEPNSLILLLSPSLRQSMELFIKCLDVYRTLGRPVPANTENKLSLELDNGSRIISLPGKEGTIRGMSGVKLLIIDEAARVSDDLFYSVLPMLAVSGGRLILLSTPFAKRGFFYTEYLHRQNYDYYEVPATECPRISQEFLEEQRERMGEYWYQMEFCCQFSDMAGSAFRAEDIDRIIGNDIEGWSF